MDIGWAWRSKYEKHHSLPRCLACRERLITLLFFYYLLVIKSEFSCNYLFSSKMFENNPNFFRFKKKVASAFKRKTAKNLHSGNHLYWTAASSEGLCTDAVLAKWLSILNHITNVHEGHSALFPACEHGPLEGRERHKQWLKPGTCYFPPLVNK